MDVRTYLLVRKTPHGLQQALQDAKGNLFLAQVCPAGLGEASAAPVDLVHDHHGFAACHLADGIGEF